MQTIHRLRDRRPHCIRAAAAGPHGHNSAGRSHTQNVRYTTVTPVAPPKHLQNGHLRNNGSHAHLPKAHRDLLPLELFHSCAPHSTAYICARVCSCSGSAACNAAAGTVGGWLAVMQRAQKSEREQPQRGRENQHTVMQISCNPASHHCSHTRSALLHKQRSNRQHPMSMLHHDVNIGTAEPAS